MSKYIPYKESDRIAFYKTFNSGAKELGLQLGLTQDDINNIDKSTVDILSKVDATQALFTSYQAANADKKENDGAHSKLIISMVNKMKNSGNWSDAAAKTFTVYMPALQTDFNNIKPIPTLKIITGLIHVLFEKHGLTGVNIYGKINDDKDFVYLGSPTTSPFIDDRPLRTSGVAEIRYYKIVGVKNDVEVGHASDVIWIAYAG